MRPDIFVDPRIDDLRPRPVGLYATPDELYTIKHSHAYWELKNGSWNKHMWDLLELQRRGAKLIPSWHDVLYKVWEDRHGRKPVQFDQESRSFFADAVKRKYDHDSLHQSVAYGDRPLYESVLAKGAQVKMDMGKVWALPFEDQVELFREEIYVTALERIVIPKNYKVSAGAAYQWALRRTITSLTKGKSAQFIVSNFDIFRKPDMLYVQHHLSRKDRLIEL
jgi:hypothetical protein